MSLTLTQKKQGSAVMQGLSKLLANTYALYLKTQNYHWNVTGPQFNTLHGLFEQQYTELSTAADEIAERIRALGSKAPGSFAAFSKGLDISEASGEEKSNVMIENLAKDNGILAQLAGQVEEAASQAGDSVTVDMATDRNSVHQKATWMLKSHLE